MHHLFGLSGSTGSEDCNLRLRRKDSLYQTADVIESDMLRQICLRIDGTFVHTIEFRRTEVGIKQHHGRPCDQSGEEIDEIGIKTRSTIQRLVRTCSIDSR